MAVVYLPFGYPVVGGVWDSVVYQGTVARMYNDLDKDPRSESQLMNRYLLADISRVRATMGLWGKDICKIEFGSRWSAVVYQLVKGDVDGYWSEGVGLFDEFSEIQKVAWREYAPYQVTYNDPGRVWYGLCWTLFRWFNDHGVTYHDMSEPLGGTYGEVRAWWLAGREDYGFQWAPFEGEEINVDDDRIYWDGDWHVYFAAGLYGGRAMYTHDEHAYARIVLV